MTDSTYSVDTLISIESTPAKATLRKRWGACGAAGLTASTLLMFLSASTPESTQVAISSSTAQQIDELAGVLSESMSHFAAVSPEPMKECVSSLVRVVEGYHAKPGPGKSKPLNLHTVTPSCHYLSLKEQQDALNQIAIMLRYQATILGGQSQFLMIAAFLCALPAMLLPLAYYCYVVSPRRSKGKRTREACSCRVCKGRYIVGREIGSGGFARAFLAEVSGKSCVLKMIEVDLENGINQAQTALEEAKNLMKLSHSHIVKYCDVFLHRTTQQTQSKFAEEEQVTDYVCILMELCDGTLLHQLEQGSLASVEVLGFLEQSAAGFAYMHSKRCIHRDVKPENIFFQKDKQTGAVVYKIGDFGLALTTDGAQCCGLVPYGTTAFMSPECFDRQSMDSATDVWSLGVSLLETVVGDNHIRCLEDAGVTVPPPSDTDCDEASLCEVALADPEAWDRNREIIVAHFTDKLQAIYNAEYYKLQQQRGDEEDLTLADMFAGEVALSVVPGILRSMLAFRSCDRPSMKEICKRMRVGRGKTGKRLGLVGGQGSC